MSDQKSFPMMDDKEFVSLIENLSKQDTFPFNFMGISNTPINNRKNKKNPQSFQYPFDQNFVNSIHELFQSQQKGNEPPNNSSQITTNQPTNRQHNPENFMHPIDQLIDATGKINQFVQGIHPLINNFNKMFRR